jgi:hypothetical protein
MNPELAKIGLQLISRVQIRGAEAKAYVAFEQELLKSIPKEELEEKPTEDESK